MFSTMPASGVAVMTVACPGKRMAMHKHVQQGRWDANVKADNCPSAIIVIVEGDCQVMGADKDMCLGSLSSEWGEGTAKLAAVVRCIKKEIRAVAECFAHGRWWGFDGERAQSVKRSTPSGGFFLCTK